jgi:hypothetical protein
VFDLGDEVLSFGPVAQSTIQSRIDIQTELSEASFSRRRLREERSVDPLSSEGCSELLQGDRIRSDIPVDRRSDDVFFGKRYAGKRLDSVVVSLHLCCSSFWDVRRSGRLTLRCLVLPYVPSVNDIDSDCSGILPPLILTRFRYMETESRVLVRPST